MAGAKRSPMSAAGFAWRLLLVHLGSSFLAGLTFYELRHLLWGSLWQCTLLGGSIANTGYNHSMFDPDFGKASALVASSFLPLLLGQGLNYLVVRALLTLAKRIHRRLPVARPGAQ